jgi:hypothetical protein
MFLARWLPTVVAFPVGGELAILAVGSLDGPLAAAIGGAIAGSVIGAAQWLALRSRGFGWRWALMTALAMAGGGALAALLTGAATTPAALALTGLVTGALVGGAQATQLGRGRGTAAAWTGLVGLSWAIGWLVTANVIVDAERGFYVFGLSGALVVTVATGLAMSRLLSGPRGVRRTSGSPRVDRVVAATR